MSSPPRPVKGNCAFVMMLVSPTEIEEVLIAHPKITDCCVIGVPDDKHGEVPLAFIVANSINEESIHAHVKERLAPFKRLRGGIKFLDVIPRTPTGKTLKRKLKDEYLKTLKWERKDGYLIPLKP
ncbi:hypothetical protein ANCDUO_20561 [Ancylostoma duodenale]|uniref:AMP-binding enzyme C-terminal domain-containing protein n=1 Tax=Ancylostoma duodenale TaxID=51022 RepID=A0A0C2FRU0_9BILA|nr:hypothetical protein ANCDUO_20561 [Ancylostoma duodenale]